MIQRFHYYGKSSVLEDFKNMKFGNHYCAGWKLTKSEEISHSFVNSNPILSEKSEQEIWFSYLEIWYDQYQDNHADRPCSKVIPSGSVTEPGLTVTLLVSDTLPAGYTSTQRSTTSRWRIPGFSFWDSQPRICHYPTSECASAQSELGVLEKRNQKELFLSWLIRRSRSDWLY